MASNETLGDLDALAAAVVERRRQLGLTQEEVVTRAGRGLSESSLYRIENAKRPEAAVSRVVLKALDDALDWPAGRARAIYTPDLVATDYDGNQVVIEAKTIAKPGDGDVTDGEDAGRGTSASWPRSCGSTRAWSARASPR